MAEVAGHIRHLDGDNKQYLVPICRPCNNLSPYEDYWIDGSVKLVYANSRHGGVRPNEVPWGTIGAGAAGGALLLWIVCKLNQPAPQPQPPPP